MEDKHKQLESLLKKEKMCKTIKNIFVGALPILIIAQVYRYSEQGKLGLLTVILGVVIVMAVSNILYLKKVREDIAKLG